MLAGIGCPAASRMLKTSASGVLASLRGSTYRSVRLASSLAAALLAAILSILRGGLMLPCTSRFVRVSEVSRSFFSLRDKGVYGHGVLSMEYGVPCSIFQ